MHSTPPMHASSYAWWLVVIVVVCLCGGHAYADVGGGYTAAGLHGEYFSNATWSGAPAFSRQDDRVEFPDIAPSNHLPPGGSISTGFNAVGVDNWSARWTGEVIPRFSETYTFKVFARGSCVVGINGVKVIDQQKDTGQPTTGTIAMTAGTAYHIEIDFAHQSGDWALTVHWLSPSTPEELIDPLSVTGVHALYYGYNQTWANQILGASGCRGLKGGPVAQDAFGWPTTDGRFLVLNGGAGSLGDGTNRNRGTCRLQFTGRADVASVQGNFTCDGKQYGHELPVGVGWDAKTNTTSATIAYPKGISDLEWLAFTQTRRLPTDTTATGVTNVSLMSPTTLGGDTPIAAGVSFNPQYMENISRYTTLRFPHFEYFEPDYTKYKWSERVPGQWCMQAVNFRTSLEWMILLCNEAGKDCFFQIPVEAPDDYVQKTALLFRYGSDGLNPYDPNHDRDSKGNDLYNPAPPAGPKYPPLNGNLNLYFELGNEVWDAYQGPGGYGSAATYCRKACMDQVPGEDHSAQRAIINYDGKVTGPHGGMRRWHLLRTKEISDIFRAVFPAEMPDGTARIRPLWEWQADVITSFEEKLRFFDCYFNNADGVQHVKTPHPISYFIWGSGGDIYYDLANNSGAQTAVAFANPSFEANAIAPGTTSHDVQGWQTTGNAGVYHDNAETPMISGQTPGTPRVGDKTEVGYGFQFTVGDSDLMVYEIGRWVAPGNSLPHTITVIQASDGRQINFTVVPTKGASAGTYAYTKLHRPLVLSAKTVYCIISNEQIAPEGFGARHPDKFCDQDTTITAQPGITLDGAVSATRKPDWAHWALVKGTSGDHAYGPIDFKVVKAPGEELGYVLNAPDGEQAAYIADTGTLSQTVAIAKPGIYAVKFQAAGPTDKCNRLRIFVTDPAGTTTEITPLHLSDWRPSTDPYLISQAWNHDYRNYDWNTSNVFKVSTPGQYTFKIAGTDKGKYLYLDNMQFVSVDAMFPGGLGGGNSKDGKPAYESYATQLRDEASWSLAYGMKDVAYEGGWEVGSDFQQLTFQTWAKFCDPRAKQSLLDVIDLFTKSGGSVFICGSYVQWPQGLDSYYVDASRFMFPQAVDECDNRLRPEPTNGTVLPATLTPRNATLVESADKTGTIHNTGGWIDWNVITRTTATYTVTATTDRGSTVVLVDNTILVPPHGKVRLTAGIHSIKCKSTDGPATVNKLDIANDSP